MPNPMNVIWGFFTLFVALGLNILVVPTFVWLSNAFASIVPTDIGIGLNAISTFAIYIWVIISTIGLPIATIISDDDNPVGKKILTGTWNKMRS